MKTYLLISEAQLLNLNKLLLIFLLLFNVNLSKAQECATPDVDIQEAANLPWFGNPDYLPSFMDSLNQAETPSQGNNISSIVPNIKWRIPIKFWIPKIYI